MLSQQILLSLTQGSLDNAISIDKYNVKKIAIHATSDDTGESIPIQLSIEACIPEEPRMLLSIITKTCPCNKQRFLKFYKMKNFSRKFLIFFLFFSKHRLWVRLVDRLVN